MELNVIFLSCPDELKLLTCSAILLFRRSSINFVELEWPHIYYFYDMRSFAQEKKSQQAPEIDALVRDRKVFAWCHKIN